MLYRVPIKITFNGFAIVEAQTEEDACVKACLYLDANLGDVYCGDEMNIKDYYLGIKGITEIRDDESIEEIGG